MNKHQKIINRITKAERDTQIEAHGSTPITFRCMRRDVRWAIGNTSIEFKKKYYKYWFRENRI